MSFITEPTLIDSFMHGPYAIVGAIVLSAIAVSLLNKLC